MKNMNVSHCPSTKFRIFHIHFVSLLLGGAEETVCERQQHHHVPRHDQREDCRAQDHLTVLGLQGNL